MRQACYGAALAAVLFCQAVTEINGSTAEPSPEPGPIQRLEETVKRAGKSLEETMKTTGKKIEEEKIPEKVEKKAKEIMNDAVDAVEKTGKHLENTFK
ncbi:MAG TPA: hypothetical protein VFS39_09170 [Nitrospira sp.]|nr:hypothetical protein [Nitrospira sp.]